jgi:hypothetical protein
MTRLWLLSVLAWLPAGCREEVHELQLVFGAGDRPSEGLSCHDTDEFLIDEIWRDDGAACLVIDIIPTDGHPGCRLSELLAWCSDHHCRPDPDLRVKLDLDPFLPEMRPKGPGVNLIYNKIVEGLSGTEVYSDAPEQVAILRATLVATACTEVPETPRFACGDVVGCMFSCPIAIGSFDGELVLDLDSLNPATCLRDIRTCAGDDLFDRAHVMSPCDTDPMQ